jgi:hypothetical protein
MRKFLTAVIIVLLSLLSSPGLPQSSPDFAALLEMERSNRFPFCGKLDLSQNYPNPFRNDQKTIINYRAIDGEQVSLVIYNPKGKKALIFERLTPGIGKVSVEPNQLPPGMYTYALIVNGRMIDRKQMTITY